MADASENLAALRAENADVTVQRRSGWERLIHGCYKLVELALELE